MISRNWQSIAWVAPLVLMSACNAPARTAPPRLPSDSPKQPEQARVDAGDTKEDRSADSIEIPLQRDDPEQWLFVEAVRDGAPGAWATGDFDTERNKLTIRTKDVDQFAVDTNRVEIDWDRVVILGIDGRNSELRKRDFARYQFKHDKHGRWIVLER